MQRDQRLRFLSSAKDLPSLLAALAGGERPGRDGNGTTLLMFVVAMDWEDGFDAILPWESINDEDAYGWTALNWAILSAGPRMIERVIAAGSKPMDANKSSRDSLLIAASHGREGDPAFLDKIRALMPCAEPWDLDATGRNLFEFLASIRQHEASALAKILAEQQALSKSVSPAPRGESGSRRM